MDIQVDNILGDDLSARITDKEFKLLRDLIYKQFGIDLPEQKRSLIPGRLQGVLRRLELKTFNQYYEYLISDKTGQALIELVNFISTNHTFFWREKEHFEYFLKSSLPEISNKLRAQNSHDLRIWCAGCSTGEESYTIMMLMMEYFGKEYTLWDAGLLATDISDKVLNIAKLGIYPEERIALLPEPYKKRYFKLLPSSQFAVDDKLKKQIVYRRFNLMNTTFPFQKKFHIIFCRNVMIYFDQRTRTDLIKRFHDFLIPGGYLFIGHSETLGREQEDFKYIMPAVYKKHEER